MALQISWEKYQRTDHGINGVGLRPAPKAKAVGQSLAGSKESLYLYSCAEFRLRRAFTRQPFFLVVISTSKWTFSALQPYCLEHRAIIRSVLIRTVRGNDVDTNPLACVVHSSRFRLSPGSTSG